MKIGLQSNLLVGNLDSKRDWGYAPEYCEGMWLMLQKDKPDDFILATGKQLSVRKFIELSFKEVGISIDWDGSEENEFGLDNNTGKTIVLINPRYSRVK